MLTDLRFAFRLLVKQRGLTLAAVVALGVGIGLSTAVFNTFSAVLLRPFHHLVDEDRVIFIEASSTKEPEAHLDLSIPDFLDLRERATTFSGLSVVMDRTIIFGGGPHPERVLGSSISSAAFSMLGVQPLLGRTFRADEEKEGAPLTAILGHALWQRRFGGREEVIGQSVLINGDQVTIVGVMPAGFQFPETSELWTPFIYQVKEYSRGDFSYPGFARIRDGYSLAHVQAELDTLGANLATEHAGSNTGVTFRARLLRDQAIEETAMHLKLMLCATLFVLLIACANVANLLLAMSTTRTREMAIRVAVGATRGRIVRQVITESLLLGTLGGLFGVLVATWANGLILGAIPVELPFWMKFDFDWRVFAFAAVTALGSALLFGLFPALQASRFTTPDMREGGRGTSQGRRTQRLRNVLVVAQVALALVLLIGAGLMVRSFLRLQYADFGFKPENVLSFRVGLPPTQYLDPEFNRRFFTQLQEKLGAIPGVQSASATTLLPSVGEDVKAFVIEGQPVPATLLDSPLAVSRSILPGYFQTMRTPLLRGRDFTLDDRPGRPKVVIVDQAFVERWFPDEDALGKRITYRDVDNPDDWATIVGIVGTIPQRLGHNTPRYGLYRPALQETHVSFLSMVMHTRGAPEDFIAPAQQAVVAVERDIPIYNVVSLTKLLERSYWDRKFLGQVFSAFGLGALFLASLGIYGVMSYTVAQRTQEIGIRMALGAQAPDVLRMVSRQGLMLVGAGLALGLIGALVLTQFMASMLYGVSPKDPPTYFSLSVVLGLVGLIACTLPARRATKVDPVVAIRSE